MTLRAALTLAAVTSACGVSGADVWDPRDAGAPPPTPTGYYSVSGNQILDPQGRPHLLHGLDRPSLEWSARGEQLSAEDYRRMAAWKANVVRLAVDQDFWLAGAASHDPGYAATLDQQVAWAHAAGLDVILDLHWSDGGDLQAAPAPHPMPDENSLEFWREVAARWKGDGHVFFELYNEPHDVSWEVWRDGGDSGAGYLAVGMQELTDAIRATGADNLVIIGGLDYAYDLSGVPGHRVAGDNLVYATHPYDLATKQPDDWDRAWGALAATDPVMVTEFGSFDCGSSYYQDLIDYADARQVSWSAWAWYVNGCGFPSIIADWDGTPNAAGVVVKAALALYQP